MLIINDIHDIKEVNMLWTLLLFPLYRQWTSYSCMPAVAQMLVEHFTGEVIPHGEMIRKLRAKPDGITFDKLRRFLRTKNLRTRTLEHTEEDIDQALQAGSIVIADRVTSRGTPHVYAITARVFGMYVMVDPKYGIPVPWCPSKAIDGAEEMYAISGSRGRKCKKAAK